MIKDIVGLLIGIGLVIMFFTISGASILALAIGGVGAFLMGRSIRNIIQKV